MFHPSIVAPDVGLERANSSTVSTNNKGATKKGRRSIALAALKHGSAVGCPAAGSCFHAVTGIADLISSRSPERICPTSLLNHETSDHLLSLNGNFVLQTFICPPRIGK
jgi:hypothetical protein